MIYFSITFAISSKVSLSAPLSTARRAASILMFNLSMILY
nr:MAG TPA: hypothetical protein [Caudoviricetes sp.]